MTYNNIEGKFYPMQQEEFLMSRKELTPAQRDIFYHLKILNPFGDRFTNICVKEIAEVLELSKRTVSDALKVLYQLGWIDLELISADCRVCPCASNKFNNAVKFPSMEKLSQGEEKLSQGEEKLSQGEEKLPQGEEKLPQGEEKLPQGEEKLPQIEQLQPLPDIGFGSPHTNKTIKTNKISLLDKKEREKFLEFANKKVDELPKRPQLPKKWIDKNHDELWAEYQELEQRKEANEQQRKQSINKPQETVVDPRIAADLENGKILQIDHHNKMFRDTDGWWQKWHEYDEWKARQQSNCQPTNEELLMSKQLISAALGIESS